MRWSRILVFKLIRSSESSFWNLSSKNQVQKQAWLLKKIKPTIRIKVIWKISYHRLPPTFLMKSWEKPMRTLTEKGGRLTLSAFKIRDLNLVKKGKRLKQWVESKFFRVFKTCSTTVNWEIKMVMGPTASPKHLTMVLTGRFSLGSH